MGARNGRACPERQILPPLVPEARWQGDRLPEPPLALKALWHAAWAMDEGRTVLHLARSEPRAQALAQAMQAVEPGLEILELPPWDNLPYDRVPPSRAVMGRRMATLARLAARPAVGPLLLVTTVAAALQRLPAPSALPAQGHRLAVGKTVDLEELRVLLESLGYVLDERVDEPGEAAIRGASLEIFPADSASPCRLDLEDGRITAIRRYDPASQRSSADLEAMALSPALEPDPGDEAASLLDHLRDPHLVLDHEAEARRLEFRETAEDAFAGRAAFGGGREEPPPDRRYLGEDEWQALFGRLPQVQLDESSAPAGRLPRFGPGPGGRTALRRFLRDRLEGGDRVVLAAADGQLARLGRLAGADGAETVPVESRTALASLPPGRLGLWTAPLPEGFVTQGLAVVTAADAGLGRAAAAKPTAAALTSAPLRIGDLVVHAEHGIARLDGLDRVEGTADGEHARLSFAGGKRLLVPVSHLDLVWRYAAGAADVALDRLDGDAWQARRREVEEQLQSTAAGLEALAVERARETGPALRPDPERLRRFVAGFPYEATTDQEAAARAALSDLARGAPPMDRLVVGDVGFGKTEVALRAAAAAALSGKQVALLAPTTILVRQHLASFRRRFARLGIRVEQLSRLGSAAEARKVREGLADGSIAIVVGTHALTSPSLRFKDLGLVIVDEEQRFGARQKEALRRLRRGVHTLAMSATPIPRTLQTALAGIRDLSLVTTPPVRRQPVRTLVAPFAVPLVAEALRREKRRGGRSFVVVPRVADLEPMRKRLAAGVPDLDIVEAHGRMRAQELDEAVLAFADGAHDVLLATAIIESGLDIPRANTMIVWQPERFGMAQLHQLRGRVGRGRERAAAYLLHEPETDLPPATWQRLLTLEALEGLGAGFAIAAQDLDLRGAGDLLGEDQAGHLRVLGTELYQHLLDKALRRARGEDVPEDWSPELELGAAGEIPSDYVPEPELRLDLYRRLARLGTDGEASDIGDEIADRFGPLPESVRQLLATAELRARCRELGIARLEAGPLAVAATFRDGRLQEAAGTAAPGLVASGERLLLKEAAETPADRLAVAGRLLDLVGN